MIKMEKYTFEAEGRGLNIKVIIRTREDMEIVNEIMKKIKHNLKNIPL